MKKHKRRYNSEKEIIELIDHYKSELKTIRFKWPGDELRTIKAIGYRENRLAILKEALAIIRTPVLPGFDFGDDSVSG